MQPSSVRWRTGAATRCNLAYYLGELPPMAPFMVIGGALAQSPDLSPIAQCSSHQLPPHAHSVMETSARLPLGFALRDPKRGFQSGTPIQARRNGKNGTKQPVCPSTAPHWSSCTCGTQTGWLGDDSWGRPR